MVWFTSVCFVVEILCFFWKTVFQKQVSLPHQCCAQISSLLFWGVGKGGDRKSLPSCVSNFLFLLLLSPGRRSKKVQYRSLTINSKSPQTTWNYPREGHQAEENFSAEITPSRRSFGPRGDYRGGSANKALQTQCHPSNWYILLFQSKTHCFYAPLWCFTKPPAARSASFLTSPHTPGLKDLTS